MESTHSQNIDFLKEYLNQQQFDWIDYNQLINVSFFTSGGGTHLYLIQNETNRFLARVNFYSGKNDWGVKKIEYETLKKIEGLGIAPKVFALSTDNSLQQDFTIVEYIEGETVTEFTDNDIALLAKDLRKLHQFKIQVEQDLAEQYTCKIYDEFAQGADKHIEQYQFEGVNMVALLYNEIKNDLGLWFNGLTIFTDSKNVCLCHSDLKSENILLTENGIKLIDWECAEIDIPETDIGRLFSGCVFTYEQQQIFLSEYYESKPGKDVLNKIYAVKTVLDFFRIIEDYCIYKRKPLKATNFLTDLEKFKHNFSETRAFIDVDWT